MGFLFKHMKHMKCLTCFNGNESWFVLNEDIQTECRYFICIYFVVHLTFY